MIALMIGASGVVGVHRIPAMCMPTPPHPCTCSTCYIRSRSGPGPVGRQVEAAVPAAVRTSQLRVPQL